MIYNRQMGLEEVKVYMCNPRVDSHLVHLLRAMTALELWRKQDHYATFIPGIDAYGLVGLPHPESHPAPKQLFLEMLKHGNSLPASTVSCDDDTCPPGSGYAADTCVSSDEHMMFCVCMLCSATKCVQIMWGIGGEKGVGPESRLSSMHECV